MRVRTIGASLDTTHGENTPRPVPRLKRGSLTSFCASTSVSYAYGRTPSASYQFPGDCFCLSPEHHGMQFQAHMDEVERGHC